MLQLPPPAHRPSGLPSPLLRFLVRLLLIAPRAKLLPLRPLGVLAPVFGREIVPTLTDGALHDDVFSRHSSFHVGMSARLHDASCRRADVPFVPRYFRIFVTTPAPTVLPPSRMANRSCSSIAIGVISSIAIFVLSPGITISTPAGNTKMAIEL